MAKKAKARLINVRLISMAMTGFFYTFKRPRTAPMMGMLKYDPIGTNRLPPYIHLLFPDANANFPSLFSPQKGPLPGNEKAIQIETFPSNVKFKLYTSGTEK
ncbi:hypothetical protein H0G86_003036 [Trichoderma simmonsii]|uniref:Large ribosomal subunit protein bL33m n=1 Tax=Trichoderma simmonsii TaxID=1491479 RepID=A0A8G0PCS0_9HYPO|nr:hypothetical protein H0G86_003036 [Trichoderma simmonsii]